MSVRGAPMSRAKYARFWRIVRSPYTDAAWVSYATRLRSIRDPAGSPSTVTVPAATFWTPTIERISVVLPQPDGPSRPVIWPRGMSSPIPSNTSVTPRRTRSPRTSTAAFGAGMGVAELFIT